MIFKDQTSTQDEPVILPDTEERERRPEPEPVRRTVPSWVLGMSGALVGLILAAGAYLLFVAPRSEESPADVPEATVTVEQPSEDEILAIYDEDIARAEGDERFTLTLDKVSRLISMGRFNEALAILAEISDAGLDDAKLYQLYSTYTFLYETMGSQEELSIYTAKFDEVYARLEAAGQFDNLPTEGATNE